MRIVGDFRYGTAKVGGERYAIVWNGEAAERIGRITPTGDPVVWQAGEPKRMRRSRSSPPACSKPPEAHMATTYEAYRYAAGGHAGEIVPGSDSDGAIIATGTREECMAAIRKRLGDGFERREWCGQFEDVAAYSESDAEGCGGRRRPGRRDFVILARDPGGRDGPQDPWLRRLRPERLRGRHLPCLRRR
jgi:hypothetical protein